MGPQAAAANAGLVDGAMVYLERDVSETDSFGRLLRYVWLDRGEQSWLLVNLRLVERGLAQVSTFPPDVKYEDLFLAATDVARWCGWALGHGPDRASHGDGRTGRSGDHETDRETHRPADGEAHRTASLRLRR